MKECGVRDEGKWERVSLKDSKRWKEDGAKHGVGNTEGFNRHGP